VQQRGQGKKPKRAELMREIISLAGLPHNTRTKGYFSRLQLLELHARLTNATTPRLTMKESKNGIAKGTSVR
jgi:hypothetical protein